MSITRSIKAYIAAHVAICEGEQLEEVRACLSCGRPIWTHATRCPSCTEAARPLFAAASDRRMREVMS